MCVGFKKFKSISSSVSKVFSNKGSVRDSVDDVD